MARFRDDKLFAIEATEYNGEQEYSYHYAVWAKDIDEATTITRAFFNDWYGDDGEDHTYNDDPDSFEFHTGVRIRIYSIKQTTKQRWIAEMFERYTLVK
jgi:hypothetical protein